MKQNRIRLIQELLITQINFIVFYPFCMTVSTLFGDIVTPTRPSLLVWMLGGLTLLAMYFIRVRAKNFLVFALLHGLCLGVVLALGQVLTPGGSSTNKIFFIMVAIGYMGYSLYLRLTTEDFEDHCMNMPFAVGFVAVSMFMQHYRNNTEWDYYYKLVLIIVIGFFFLHYYLKEYLNFLIVNSSSTGILPEKEIFGSGLRLSILYTVIGVVILFATSQLTWLKDLLAALKKLTVSIIRYISSLFPKTHKISEAITNETGNGGAMALPIEQGEPAMIWYVIFGILLVAFVIVIFVAVFMAIRRFIAFVAQRMKKGVAEHSEVSVTGAVDVREKCEIQKSSTRKSKPLELFGFMDAKEKIRRIYKKKAAAYKPSPLMANDPARKNYSPEKLPFYTVREMEFQMDAGAFAEIYEKARYSNEACTPQDVKLMKEYCK